jgi:Ni/Fe-hydrogenase subunit HybB-like protein
MVFAFSVFWMYLFFSQYIVIWYGNLPEETHFLRARLGSQFLQDTWFFVLSRLNEPYVNLSMAAWVGCWIIPFVLLMGQRPKRSPAMLGTVATLVLLGFWFERNALVWPSLVPEQGWAWLGPIQIGIAAGFLGAFALVFLVFSRVFPTLPLPRR